MEKLFGCGLFIIVLVFNVVFWGAVTYIALHFIGKFW